MTLDPSNDGVGGAQGQQVSMAMSEAHPQGGVTSDELLFVHALFVPEVLDRQQVALFLALELIH